jgi:hypothetical protein
VDKSTRKRKRRRDNPDGGPRVLKIYDDLGDLTSGLLLDDDNTGGPRVLKISDDLGDLTSGLL